MHYFNLLASVIKYFFIEVVLFYKVYRMTSVYAFDPSYRVNPDEFGSFWSKLLKDFLADASHSLIICACPDFYNGNSFIMKEHVPLKLLIIFLLLVTSLTHKCVIIPQQYIRTSDGVTTWASRDCHRL